MTYMVVIGIAAYSLLFATLSAVIAWKKNRNKVGYFFLGMFTGVIGLVIILALPAPYCEPGDGPICESGSGFVSGRDDREG